MRRNLTKIILVNAAFCLTFSCLTPAISDNAQPYMISLNDLAFIPGGEFEMGDHHDLGGREHPSDEIPVHTVKLNSFYIGRSEVTTTQYVHFLNDVLKDKQISVSKDGLVISTNSKIIYCDTNISDTSSRILWNGKTFSFSKNKAQHPIVCVRWEGAALFCNWLSKSHGLLPCYNISTWKCDFSKNGFRLPTEAEWEYAARGGKYPPYTVYTHGNEVNKSIANLPNSGDPFETGPYPWTTPVAFYDGKLKRKADFNWPGKQISFQTGNGANGYGLYDMQGNVWEWVNDWYQHNYYENSPSINPQGPATGRVMRDGKRYHACRSGNWYNGYDGHSRISNRNVAYYRGPDDPDHSWYHFGFRVARNGDTAPKEGRSNVSQTKPQNDRRSNRQVSRSYRRQPHRSPEESFGEVERQLGLIKNTSKAFPGYTLFAPKHYTKTYLMRNDGQIVNTWESEYEPGQSVYLLENGHLLRCCLTKNKAFIGGGEGGRLEEYDWDGNLVWEYWLSDDKNLMHHDISVMPNGNILAMVVELKSLEETIQAGFGAETTAGDNMRKLESLGYVSSRPTVLKDKQLFPDYIVEIKKTGPKSGKIVWQWHVWDHLVQDSDPRKDNYGNVSKTPGKIDPNGSGRRVKAFWNHMNSIDYNPKLDQIVLSVRGNSEIWIIDHSITTAQAKGKAGDLIYRWGNPQTYKQGSENDRQLYQQHDSQWIPPDCPGAGNILIFNNGIGRDFSSIDEIVPPINSKGNYKLSRDGTYGPDKPVWTYTDVNPKTFYSQEISGCQRLPNGNTLICAGVHGTFFEVTPQGKTVWEYVNPVTTRLLTQGQTVPLDHRYHSQNAVFKVHRYPLDYPAFKGKDLTPKGLLVENPTAPKSPTLRAMQAYAGKKPDSGRQRGGDRQRPPQDQRRRQSGGGRFAKTDTNRDGIISFAEFCAHEKQKKGSVDTQREKRRFDQIDTDRNGTVSEQELQQAPKGNQRGRK